MELDEALLEHMLHLMPRRELDRFVDETPAARVDTLEREQREAMKESYMPSWHADPQLVADWEVMDLKNWPERAVLAVARSTGPISTRLSAPRSPGHAR